jgi:hypothetical protein
MMLASPRTVRTVDTVGRWLLRLAALTAVVAAVGNVPSVREAGAQSVVVELWRLYGLLVFAGLFLVLSGRPRGNRVLWAITMASKAALAVKGIVLLLNDSRGPVVGATDLVLWDGVLTLLLVAAFCCCRGWARSAELPGRGVPVR